MSLVVMVLWHSGGGPRTYEDGFLVHLNSIDEDIKWTAEKEVVLPTSQTVDDLESIEVRSERALAFLDSWSIVNDDGTVWKLKCLEKKLTLINISILTAITP